MKKKLAVTMAVAAGLCFAGGGHLKPAFAGYWEEVPDQYVDQYGGSPYSWDPTYAAWQAESAQRIVGTSSITSSYNGQSGSNSFSWDDSGMGLSNAGFGAPPGLNTTTEDGTTLYISSVGKRLLKFRWVPDQINGVDDPTDTAPASLNIEAYLGAVAEQRVSGDVENVGNVDAQTSVGVGTTETYSGDQTAASLPENPFYASSVYKTLPITILNTPENKDADGNLCSPWFKYSGSVQADTYVSDEVANVEFFFDWDFDNRAVGISSDIEPSNHNENGIPTPNLPDGNGNIVDDSVVTGYNQLGKSLGMPNYYSSLLGTSPVNFTNPSYSWSVAGGDVLLGNDVTFPDNVSVQVDLGDKEDTTFPSTATALTVTDEDGLQLTAHNTIRWHPPVEWNSEPKSSQLSYDVVDPVQMIQDDAGYTGNNVGKFTFENFYADAILQGSEMTMQAGSAIAPVLWTNPEGVSLGLLLQAGNIVVTDLAPTTDLQKDCSFETAWMSGQTGHTLTHFSDYPSFPEGGRPLINDDPNHPDNEDDTKKLYALHGLRLEVEMNNRVIEGDEYWLHGFKGITSRGERIATGVMFALGNFEYAHP